MRLTALALLLVTLSVWIIAGGCGKDEPAIKSDLSGLSLLTAIAEDKVAIVQLHMDARIDPNKVSIPEGLEVEGAYPLHLAILKGNEEIVQILLDNGAKVDLRAANKDKATPLHWAAFFGQTDLVSLLIEAGAPVNALDAHQSTPSDSGLFMSVLSEGDEKTAGIVREILTILKSNGGKHSYEL